MSERVGSMEPSANRRAVFGYRLSPGFASFARDTDGLPGPAAVEL